MSEVHCGDLPHKCLDHLSPGPYSVYRTGARCVSQMKKSSWLNSNSPTSDLSRVRSSAVLSVSGALIRHVVFFYKHTAGVWKIKHALNEEVT